MMYGATGVSLNQEDKYVLFPLVLSAAQDSLQTFTSTLRKIPCWDSARKSEGNPVPK